MCAVVSGLHVCGTRANIHEAALGRMRDWHLICKLRKRLVGVGEVTEPFFNLGCAQSQRLWEPRRLRFSSSLRPVWPRQSQRISYVVQILRHSAKLSVHANAPCLAAGHRMRHRVGRFAPKNARTQQATESCCTWSPNLSSMLSNSLICSNNPHAVSAYLSVERVMRCGGFAEGVAVVQHVPISDAFIAEVLLLSLVRRRLKVRVPEALGKDEAPRWLLEFRFL